MSPIRRFVTFEWLRGFSLLSLIGLARGRYQKQQKMLAKNDDSE